MKHVLAKWLRKTYNQITGSIAFYPALIAIGFLLLSWIMLELDFSESGKHIKSNYYLIRLRDASTARTIVSTIVTGIISLAVFSFSMVMILLNQAASQLSNRTLENMIANRFQQLVLGSYIGTIVYALFLLSTIRDLDTGIYVPALSIYLLVLFTVGDIFLFIYFLHFITQTVKFETIIKRVQNRTLKTLQLSGTSSVWLPFNRPDTVKTIISMPAANYYQSFDDRDMMRFAEQHDGIIVFLHPKGTYLLKGMPLLEFYAGYQLSDRQIDELLDALDFYVGQPVEKNAYFGFHQLTEIALKALSPGINDPQTAVLSLNALTALFAYLLNHTQPSALHDKRGQVRLYLRNYSFEELFAVCYPPVWHYGAKDPYLQQAVKVMLIQLLSTAPPGTNTKCIINFLDQNVE
ncbi:DUF2254 domain-containing protein [Mucilaginibacter robiniae]|uniref:DUF2254 domain-containing protein n=1 Tax=Mucilaginibacter robiniae TaxID=2728022 RepID=A0A7L5DZ89_9SPHI|nr:DUF2254 domain-containing protein [Mucilaginibacter robiniae]QJD95417.1 DUF2254 domain-containing protein [Mucilaginibacter robiniae]